MGKARYRGKDLTEVRSPQRKLEPDNAGSEELKQTSLRGIANKAKANKQHRFQNLYRCLNKSLLRESWRELNKDAASGVDNVTAAEYSEHLDSNLQTLAKRLKSKRYRAKLVRRCYIPKENGKERPLGIPALEDKLVQLACTKLLTAIYEQDFLDCSHGYRPKRSAKDAAIVLRRELQGGRYGYIVEADIQGFFDNLDHDWLLEMLSLRIDDRAFLHLISKWLKAGVLDTDGTVLHPESGSPQGGIISPILANVYLHYALDLWFQKVVKAHCRGKAELCRYADDFVCVFRDKRDAERFYQVLPKRVGKFCLQLEQKKTQIMRFSRSDPHMKQGFSFLGFDFYWKKDRWGTPRVMCRTSRKKLQGACRRVKEWIRQNRHLPGSEFFKGLNSRLRGHYNYYGIKYNYQSLNRFYKWAIECTFKWLNRRGGKRNSYTKETLARILCLIGIARPRITEAIR